MNEIQKSILKTLSYADIFAFPLTFAELDYFLITARRIREFLIQKELSQLLKEKLVEKRKNYYFLPERKKYLPVRFHREGWAIKKKKIAQRVANFLRLIPWIKMVGITGALSVNNSQKSDDIDLLIVCAENRLWLTRIFTVLLVELVAQRRRPGEKKVKDKICLNMFLDEKNLMVPKKERNLFTAHEVAQLKPLWQKDKTYQKFLSANGWLKEHLGNAVWTNKRKNEKTERQKRFLVFQFLSFLLNLFEQLAYRLQLGYMKGKRTTEITEPGRIRFHPQDCREWIMLEYSKRLEAQGIK